MQMAHSVVPYLTVKGANEAIDFYKKAFGATENSRMPAQGGNPPVAVALAFGAPVDVDRTYKQAVDAGAKSELAPEDTFWKARFAMLIDPFGHRWMLNAPLPAHK